MSLCTLPVHARCKRRFAGPCGTHEQPKRLLWYSHVHRGGSRKFFFPTVDMLEIFVGFLVNMPERGQKRTRVQRTRNGGLPRLFCARELSDVGFPFDSKTISDIRASMKSDSSYQKNTIARVTKLVAKATAVTTRSGDGDQAEQARAMMEHLTMYFSDCIHNHVEGIVAGVSGHGVLLPSRDVVQEEKAAAAAANLRSRETRKEDAAKKRQAKAELAAIKQKEKTAKAAAKQKEKTARAAAARQQKADEEVKLAEQKRAADLEAEKERAAIIAVNKQKRLKKVAAQELHERLEREKKAKYRTLPVVINVTIKHHLITACLSTGSFLQNLLELPMMKQPLSSQTMSWKLKTQDPFHLLDKKLQQNSAPLQF